MFKNIWNTVKSYDSSKLVNICLPGMDSINGSVDDEKCSTPALTDDDIKDAFLSAANKLLETKVEVIANGKEMLGLLFKTNELEAERDRLVEEAQINSDAIQQNIAENARVALDQTDCQKRYDDLTSRYEKLKGRVDEISDQIQNTKSRKAAVENFLKAFEKTPDSLTEFTIDAFVDHLTVHA